VTVWTAAVVAVLYGAGVYMILQRTLTRVVLGLALLSHGANLLLLIVGGQAGIAPIVGRFTGDDTIADPVPQALVLTAIVISFAMTAFLLALAYRSWQLTRDDTVEDDVEDRRLAARARSHGRTGDHGGGSR
jgi:multicomponent Na+:H+ antiporter subunit C